MLITGDGNCFYRALAVAFLEDLCLNPRQARLEKFLDCLAVWKVQLEEWDDGHSAQAICGLRRLQVTHFSSNMYSKLSVAPCVACQ